MMRAFGPALRLSDSDGLAWFWGLGMSPIYVDGVEHDIASRWAEMCESIAAHLDVWSPPMLRAYPGQRPHDPTGEVIGLVKRARVLTQEEALALGVAQDHPEALYLGVEFNPAGQRYDADDQLPYVSVGLDIDWTDEDGVTHAAVLKELSSCAVPKLKRGQPHRSELRSLSLAEVQMLDDDKTTGMDAADEAPTPVTLEQVAALIDERIAAAMSQINAADSEDDLDAAEPGSEAEQIAALTAEVEALRAKLAERDARADVMALAETRVVEADDVDDLVALRLSDSPAYRMVVKRLPKRPAPTERKAVGLSLAEGVVPDGATPGEIALMLEDADRRAGRDVKPFDAYRRQAKEMAR